MESLQEEEDSSPDSDLKSASDSSRTASLSDSSHTASVKSSTESWANAPRSSSGESSEHTVQSDTSAFSSRESISSCASPDSSHIDNNSPCSNTPELNEYDISVGKAAERSNARAGTSSRQSKQLAEVATDAVPPFRTVSTQTWSWLCAYRKFLDYKIEVALFRIAEEKRAKNMKFFERTVAKFVVERRKKEVQMMAEVMNRTASEPKLVAEISTHKLSFIRKHSDHESTIIRQSVYPVLRREGRPLPSHSEGELDRMKYPKVDMDTRTEKIRLEVAKQKTCLMKYFFPDMRDPVIVEAIINQMIYLQLFRKAPRCLRLPKLIAYRGEAPAESHPSPWWHGDVDTRQGIWSSVISLDQNEPLILRGGAGTTQLGSSIAVQPSVVSVCSSTPRPCVICKKEFIPEKENLSPSSPRTEKAFSFFSQVNKMCLDCKIMFRETLSVLRNKQKGQQQEEPPNQGTGKRGQQRSSRRTANISDTSLGHRSPKLRSAKRSKKPTFTLRRHSFQRDRRRTIAPIAAESLLAQYSNNPYIDDSLIFSMLNQFFVEVGWAFMGNEAEQDSIDCTLDGMLPLPVDNRQSGFEQLMCEKLTPVFERRKLPVEKFYRNQNRVLLITRVGDGCLYYPSGNKAIIAVNAATSNRCYYLVYEDSRKNARLMAIFDTAGRGTCYGSRGDIVLCYTLSGGVVITNAGRTHFKWNWSEWDAVKPQPSRLFRPIVLQLSAQIGVHLADWTHVVLTFCCDNTCIELNVGCGFIHKKKKKKYVDKFIRDFKDNQRELVSIQRKITAILTNMNKMKDEN